MKIQVTQEQTQLSAAAKLIVASALLLWPLFKQIQTTGTYSTLWESNVAIENQPFIVGGPIQTSFIVDFSLLRLIAEG